MTKSMDMTCLHYDCSRSVVWSGSLVTQLSGREEQMPFYSPVNGGRGRKTFNRPVRDSTSMHYLISVRIFAIIMEQNRVFTH